jgi:putative restriction endonuclease
VHDRAFDCGLLTVTTEFTVKLSRKVRKHLADESTREFLGKYDGAPITLPSRFVPEKSFLKYHNEKKFADR